MLELLKDRTYIRYWLAVVIAFLGDGITRMALIYIVSQLTKDPFMIALVIFSQLIPSAVLGVFVGPITDRYSKRWIMIGADMARAMLILLMLFFQQSVGILLLLVFLVGVGKTFFEPARVASIPKIIGNHSIPTAVALFQSTVQTVNMVGPMLAGLLLTIRHTEVIFLVGAGTYVISALLIGSLQVLKEEDGEKTARQQSEPYLKSLRTGVREVTAIPSLRYLLFFMIPVIFVTGLYMTNFPSLLLIEFQVTALHFGFLEGVFAVGAIIGALWGPTLMQRHLGPGFLLVSSTILFGLGLITVYWVSQWQGSIGLWVVYVWCVFVGLFNGLYNVPLSSTFLLKLPKDMMGRGLALSNAILHFCTIGGVFLGGWIARMIGISNSVMWAGLFLVVAVLASLFLKGYQELQSDFRQEKLNQTTEVKTH
ncbi:hypothetical protein CEN49_25265 [Fischerella thermalis CCMEE 5273]|nr:hypothetical protein CEN49_25265 [Fischerella thermalis CCMEE 5273]